jgi:Carboxypeptidase regulatory-like domain
MGVNRYLAIIISALLVTAHAHAQTIRGSISGTVLDSSGAVVPGIMVVARNAETSISSEARTDDSGHYLFPLLPPGQYEVTVQQDGFKKYVRTGVGVQIAQTTRLDIALELGSVAEQVTVTAEASLVSSTTSELGQVVEIKQIQALPLNGRLFQQLVAITPGTVARSGGDGSENSAAAGARSNTQYSVNGMPWSGNNFLLDGIANNEPLNSLVNISPPLEAIQEFKVQTNNPTAEFGVFGGAAINLTIRSGTNDLHGSLFDYLRDDALNEKSYFAPSNPEFKSNQFGGTIGGPIIRNRVFFFGDYQGLRLDQGRTQTISVPTVLMRQGDLSEVPTPIYDPITGLPFDGNIIPASRINPISHQVADLYPVPNRPGRANNYVENNVIVQEVDAFDVRLDYSMDARSSLFGRVSLSQRDYDEPAPGNIFMGANNANNLSYNGVVGYTRAFGANKFYEVRAGYNKYDTEQRAEDFGINKNNELGIPNGNLVVYPETSGFASFRPSGFHNTGSPGSTNSVRIGSTIHLTNNFSWLLQKHAFKMGADLRLMRSSLTNPQTMPRGIFEFDRLVTSNRGAAGTGDAFASFLLGYPNRVRRDIVDTFPKVRRTFLGLFVQDDFRVTRDLTLQLGLRWDLATPPVDVNNRQSNFSIEDGLIHVATRENRGPNLDTHADYFAPRLGLAYSPDDGKTALRAAFGISYFPDNFGANGGTNERNYPFFQEVDLVAPNPQVPFRSVSDGLPAFASVPLTPTLTPPAGFAVFYIPAHFREDTATMWNVGVQREIGWNTMIDVSYVGTRGTNIFRSRNINVPDPGPGSIPERRPYYRIAPNITTINERDGDGRSWYDALQTKLEKRFSDGLQMLVAYTFSKTEDDITPVQAIHPTALGDRARMPALSKAIDIPHNFVVSATYELPLGEGKRFLPNAGALLEGWAVSAITTYQSGEPLDLRVSASRLNTGAGGNWPDVTCDTIGMPREIGRWFDTSCFADPAPFVFGNYTIGDVRGPSLFNTDLSLSKRTSIRNASFDIRADVFNVFNRVHLANPNVTFGNAAFGTISGTRFTPREVQIGARLLF